MEYVTVSELSTGTSKRIHEVTRLEWPNFGDKLDWMIRWILENWWHSQVSSSNDFPPTYAVLPTFRLCDSCTPLSYAVNRHTGNNAFQRWCRAITSNSHTLNVNKFVEHLPMQVDSTKNPLKLSSWCSYTMFSGVNMFTQHTHIQWRVTSSANFIIGYQIEDLFIWYTHYCVVNERL